MINKPRVIKDFEKLDIEIQEQIKLNYPYGFERHLIIFKKFTSTVQPYKYIELLNMDDKKGAGTSGEGDRVAAKPLTMVYVCGGESKFSI